MNLTAVLHGLTLLGVLGAAPLYAQEAPVSKAADPQQQISRLQAANATLAQQIEAFDEQIAAEQERPMPEKAAFEQADETLVAAKNALMETPSVANHQHVEKSRFAYLMAERKYRRANQQLAKVEQQRQAADQRLVANATQIQTLEQQQRARQLAAQEQEARQLTLQQSKTEQQRRQKAKTAQRKRDAELSKARAKNAAAMAEIKRLKAKLAPRADASKRKPAKATAKKQHSGTDKVAKASRKPSKAALPKHNSSKNRGKSQKSPEQSARTVVTRTPVKKVEPQLDRAQWIRGDRERYWALLKAAGEAPSRRRRGNNKLMQVNTYQGDRLLKQTSHSLKPLGNKVYQAKSVVRAGKTEFIIDGKRWAHLVPPSSNKDPFVFVLDARRSGEPQLLLFAKSDVD